MSTKDRNDCLRNCKSEMKRELYYYLLLILSCFEKLIGMSLDKKTTHFSIISHMKQITAIFFMNRNMQFPYLYLITLCRSFGKC